MSMRVHPVNRGIVKGTLLISPQPISFFGGVDSSTGIVVEKNHPLEHVCISGSVLAMPSSKGSTVGSYVIYGLAKRGKAPAGIIVGILENIVSAGAILSGIPMAVTDIRKLSSLFRSGDNVLLDANKGRIVKLK
ncbi:MAG: aconitase X swivel domain-containing protein [Thermoproteota archaeon]